MEAYALKEYLFHMGFFWHRRFYMLYTILNNEYILELGNKMLIIML